MRLPVWESPGRTAVLWWLFFSISKFFGGEINKCRLEMLHVIYIYYII